MKLIDQFIPKFYILKDYPSKGKVICTYILDLVNNNRQYIGIDKNKDYDDKYHVTFTNELRYLYDIYIIYYPNNSKYLKETKQRVFNFLNNFEKLKAFV